MAKRYLSAAGVSHAFTNNVPLEETRVNVDKLSVGYKWVNEHLANVNVADKRDPTVSEKEGTRTRYTYLPDNVLQYSESERFNNVLIQIGLERSKLSLLRLINFYNFCFKKFAFTISYFQQA